MTTSLSQMHKLEFIELSKKTKQSISDAYRELITDAQQNPTLEAYTELLSEKYSLGDVAVDCLTHAFEVLNFEDPPIDLHIWYEHWFHHLKMESIPFERLAGQQDCAQSLFITLGLAVGFSLAADGDPDGIKQYSNLPVLPTHNMTFLEKSQYYGQKWLRAAPAFANIKPTHVITMLDLIMPYSPGSIAKYGSITGRTHKTWTQCSDPDLSAHIFRTVFCGKHAGVTDIVLDMYDSHWDRCAELMKLFTAPKVDAPLLPDDLSLGL